MDKMEKDINSIKNKINKACLSEEYKDDLKNKLEEQLKNSENKINSNSIKSRKKNKVISYTKKILSACAACIILTSCTFADEIEDVMKNFFSNTYKEFEVSDIELKSVDTDYVTNDGISIKVDSYAIKDDSLYLVFNVLSEEEIDECYIDDYMIEKEDKKIIFDTESKNENVITKNIFKRETKKNLIVTIKVTNAKMNELKDILYLKVRKINICKKGERKDILNDWNFKLQIDNRL